MTEPTSLDVGNPGRAFARQTAMEAQLLRAAESALRNFLSNVADRAYRERTIYPPVVANLWTNAVTDILSALPSEVAEYVREDFEQSDIPDDVYTATTVVLAAAAKAFASEAELRQELNRVLNPDGFAVEQINASAGWLERTSSWGVVFREAVPGELAGEFDDLEAITAASWWDSLQETGSVWIKRIRRTTRTSATGLNSWITVTAIRLQDYSHKRWVTRHDDRVRHTHSLANGQTVPTSQPFIVGGAPIMYPGERSADYGEVVNCRCTLIGVNR